MKISTERLALPLALIITGAGAHTALAQEQGASPPPAEEGCYRYENAAWQRRPCDSAEYIEKNIPHPEILAGIGEITVKKKTPGPFRSSTVRVRQSDLGAEEDINPKTDLPEAGSDAYSIQVNVNFDGSNGAVDGLQFTNQARPMTAVPGFFSNSICVWQVDVSSQKYYPGCFTLPWSSILGQVQGVDLGSGMLATFAYQSSGGAPLAAVVAADKFGLADGKRWNNVSGGLLGLGNGSEARFTGKEGLSRTTVSAATCTDEDPLGAVYTEKSCQDQPKLDGDAAPIVSPSAATENVFTVETTNLVPVTGNPISTLPKVTFPNDWAAELEYASTPTGKCPGSTSPPLCK
jgi:hypothetical protein